MDFYEKLGTKIRKRREELGISRDKLATDLGYKSGSSITKIETGKTKIDINHFVKMAEILNFNMDLMTMGDRYSGVISVNTEKHNNLVLRLTENEADSVCEMLNESENTESKSSSEVEHD